LVRAFSPGFETGTNHSGLKVPPRGTNHDKALPVQEAGCRETLRYTKAWRHEEEACSYSPYSCPFDSYDFRGFLLYGHILDAHDPELSTVVTLQKCELIRAVLHHDDKSVFLLLNGGDILTGRSLSVVRVCPYPEAEEDERVEAKYVMDVEGEGTSLCLTAPGPVPFVRRLDGYKAKVFMFVPDAFWGSSGSVTVTLYL
jgi:E3 ubiquitin-protein ligase SIAH1